MLDSFTQFWFSHLGSIVNVLFLVLILLFLILFVVIFASNKRKKEGDIHNDDLEKTLRKVLESTDIKASPVPASTGNTDVSAEASKEVDELKQSIADKNSEIEALKQQIAEKTSEGGDEADTADLQLKLKELEAKLAEYEIIEDDIANLSMYKEENKRLRSELEKLGTEVVTEEPVKEPTEDIPESFAKPVDEQIKNYNKQESAAPVEEAITDVVTEDKVEEPAPSPLEEVIKEQEEAEKIPEAPEDLQASDDSAKDDSEEDDDIMSEFVKAVKEQGSKENPVSAVQAEVEEKPMVKDPEPNPVEEAASLDPSEEILREFEAAVVEKEKEKPESFDSAAPSALEEETDTDKILNEMDSLLGAEVSDTANEDEDPTEKLISEFEDLSKKP